MIENSITKLIEQNEFPKLLRSIKNVPKILYAKCNANVFPIGHYIAIVGTRRPSASAKVLCERLIQSLSNTDAVIVSGLAQGIDSYAHEMALHYGLKTIAVMAQGLDLKISGLRGELADNILKAGGTLISEYPKYVPSNKGMFVARNRIIAGLSQTTVIVESKNKGGSLITADFARQYARNVLAVVGNFDKEEAQGPLELLRQGLAKPIYKPEDLRDLCSIPLKSSNSNEEHISFTHNLSKESKKFYTKFAGLTKTLSELNAEEGVNAGLLFAILTELELSGLVYNTDGFRYSFKKE